DYYCYSGDDKSCSF
nr:immunoglobulin light chain junction region [Macaca mulatta]